MTVVPIRPPESEPCPFTARETQIVVRLADGMTRAQIARQLGCSESTVKSHIGHAFDKSHALSSTHLVATAIRRGWIT